MNSIQTELTEPQLAALKTSPLFNADLAPVPANARKWHYGSFAALWISMSACIPTYMLASSLIGGGMNWWQAILTIFLGNTIVLLPMVLNAHAGALVALVWLVTELRRSRARERDYRAKLRVAMDLLAAAFPPAENDGG